MSAPRKAAQVVDLTASSSGARREPLAVPPKLAMMLLKDRDLKAKLALYSLPTHGKRAVSCPAPCVEGCEHVCKAWTCLGRPQHEGHRGLM